MSKLQLTTLLMMWLIIMLPVVQAVSLQEPAAQQEVALFVKAEIPRYPRAEKIDIPGTTKPGATVTIFVNDAEARKDLIEDGIFLFKGVQLKKGDNKIKITAELAGETAEQAFDATVDTSPPLLNITLPSFVTTASANAKITVSEPVKLKVRAQGQTPPPERITGLKQANIAANEVALTWDPNKATDILEYAIYRDERRIATVRESTYRDTTVAGDKTYEYQVSAVNQGCVEGELSNILTVKTASGGQGQEAKEVKLTCETEAEKELKTGTTEIPIQLREGINVVHFTAIDAAGFTSEAEERISYDTGPPSFIETNLDKISPSYKESITIRGKLSEPGSVTAFINGKPENTVATGPDGTFEIPIKLQRVTLQSQPLAGGAAVDIGWKNKVKLEAVDIAGQKTSTPEYEIAFAVCGYGTWAEVDASEPLPTIITPRLLIEGIQQLGIAFTYKYRGGEKAIINPSTIRVKKLELSPEVRSEYDNGLVTVYNPPIRTDRRARKPEGAGYIQVNFNPVTDPWQLKDKTTDKAAKAPSNATMFEREERISQHREGECDIPGFGCIKLLLELEIPIQEEIQRAGYLPETTRVLEPTKLEQRIQRSCIEVEVAIDKRIPPKYIPEGFLKATSEFLGAVITGIDKILKPIETIGKYLFYTCLAGTVLMLVPIFLEKWNCDYKAIAQAVSGEGKFDPNVAAIGGCDKVYPAGESQDNCITCQDYKKFRADTRFYYRQICDRVNCPAAPSLQYYLKTRGTQKLSKVAVPQQAKLPRVAGEVYQGSDCAAWMQSNKKIEPGKPYKLFFSTTEIEGIYKEYLKHQGDKAGEEVTGTNCAGLHPAVPECCGYEYMQEWSSACGVSALGSTVDTFDEIKESTCLAEQKVNKNEVPGPEGTSVQCNKLFNSLAGFCSKNGGLPTETISVTPFCCEPGAAQPTGKLKDLGITGREKFLYLILVPQKTGQELFTTTTGEYQIKLGYRQEITQFEQSAQRPLVSGEQRFAINAKLEGIELPAESAAIQRFFTKENMDAYNRGDFAKNKRIYEEFKLELCKAAGYQAAGGGCTANGEQIYHQVMAIIGGKDEEYIVKPSSGLINSARCVCIPTIMAYLKQWRNIMAAVRNCVNTILLTGDGNAGVCQAVVSQYACDLIYEAIACFTQRFFTGGPQRTGLGVGGDIMGALVSAGTELSKEVEGRYGETSMYKSVFVDKKLVHSICLFAFTGTWNLDFGAIFDQAVDAVPIESYALMYPCNRRFVSYSPATTPSGLTTWVYHFGVGYAAGANSEVELKLKCSAGTKCDPNDGYDRGECDCTKTGEKTITIIPDNIPTRVTKGTILNEEVFYTIQGSRGEGNVRYDTAMLTYRWEDRPGHMETKSVECRVSQTGGANSVPPHCRFDPLALSFRCQWGEASTGILLQSAKVNAPHKIPQAVFALNENINMDISIRQDYPSPPDFKNSKFLQYVIKNQANQEVASNKDDTLAPLSRNGDYTISTTDVSSFKRVPKLERSWFGAGTGPGQDYQTKSWLSTIPNTAVPGDDIIGNVRILDKADQKVTDTRYLILDIENKDGTEKYSIYRGTGVVTIDPLSGFTNKGSAYITDRPLTSTTINFVGEVPVIAPSAGPAGAVREYFEGSIVIDLKKAPTGLAKGEKKQVWIVYNPRAVANPCLSETEKVKPQRFTITFTAFDADNFGSPNIDQPSINPLTGQEAILIQDFYAVCSEAADVERLEQQATGQIPQQELIPRLNELLKAAHRNETNMYGNISEYTDPAKQDLGNAQVYNNLRVQIQKLIEQEQMLVNSLAPFMEPLAEDLTPFRVLIEDSISAITQKRDAISRTRDLLELNGHIRDVLTTLQGAINEKKKMSDDLTAQMAAPQCSGTDAGGNAYTCRALCTAPEQETAGKLCTGLNKCCKIPAVNLCAGPKDDYRYECKNTAETGWEETPLICPTTAQKCYRISTAIAPPAPTTLEDKLLGLKTRIQTGVTIAAGITKIPTMSLEEATQYLSSSGKADLTEMIDTVLNSVNGEIKELREKLAQPSEPLPTEVSNSVNQLITQLENVAGNLDSLKDDVYHATVVQDILAVSSTLTQEVATLEAPSKVVLDAINAQLGVPQPCAEEFGNVEETKCFENACPSSDAPFNWKQVFRSCRTLTQVCCQRSTLPAVYKYDYFIRERLMVDPGGVHEFTVKFPYTEQSGVASIGYYSAGQQIYPYTRKTPAEAGVIFNDAQKIATINLPPTTINKNSALWFFYKIGAVEPQTGVTLNVECNKTKPGRSCVAKTACTSDTLEGYCPDKSQVCCEAISP